MSKPIMFKVIYDPKKKLFNLTIDKLHIGIDPVNLSRMIEYLETMMHAYTEWIKKGGDRDE